jgi:hypothetical protein
MRSRCKRSYCRDMNQHRRGQVDEFVRRLTAAETGRPGRSPAIRFIASDSSLGKDPVSHEPSLGVQEGTL